METDEGGLIRTSSLTSSEVSSGSEDTYTYLDTLATAQGGREGLSTKLPVDLIRVKFGPAMNEIVRQKWQELDVCACSYVCVIDSIL